MMLASSLATPYVMDLLLETMGLRVVPALCILGTHRTWGELHWSDTDSLSPPCDLMSLRVCASLFFSLLVGSL